MSLFKSIGIQSNIHWVNLLSRSDTKPKKEPNSEYLDVSFSGLQFDVTKVFYRDRMNTENIDVGITDLVFNVSEV